MEVIQIVVISIFVLFWICIGLLYLFSKPFNVWVLKHKKKTAAAVILSTVLSTGVVLLPLGNPGGGWWDTDWGYCKKIIIDHSYVDGNLVNFPILFDNTSSDFTNAQADGDDFVFRSSDNSTKYNHEIEWFNVSGDNRLVAHINITSLSSTVDTVIWLYYGNALAGNQQDVEGTWDSDFFAVHHMDGVNVGGIIDSTVYNHDATGDSGSPSYQQTGKIGYAVDFQPATPDCEIELDQVYSSVNNSDNILTIECWLNADTSDTKYFIAQHETAATDGIFVQYASSKIEIYFNGESTLEKSYSYINGWFYFCIKQDSNAGANQRHLFFNDTEVDTRAGTSITWNAGQNFHIANRGAGAREFDGTIDEIRLHNVSRSDSWIKTTYNTTMYPESFLSVGSEQSAPVGNQAPTQTTHKTWKSETSEEKSLNAVDVDFRPTSINVTINDAEGNTLNLTYRTNKSGIWKDADSNLSVGNGTYYCLNNSWIELPYTKYWISFNLTDGTNWVNSTKTIYTGNFTGLEDTNITQSGCARFGYVQPSATKGEFIQTAQGGVQGEPNVDAPQYAIGSVYDGWLTNHTQVFSGNTISLECIHNSWEYCDGEYWIVGLNESTYNICVVNTTSWSDFASINWTTDNVQVADPVVNDAAPVMYAINETDGFILYEDTSGGDWYVWRVNYSSGSWGTAYKISETNQGTDQIRGVEYFRKNATDHYIYYQNRSNSNMKYIKSTDGGLTWGNPDNTTGITNAGNLGNERTSIARYGKDKYYNFYTNDTGHNTRICESTDAENWTAYASIGATDTIAHGCLLNQRCLLLTYALGASQNGWNWGHFENVSLMQSYANKTDTPSPVNSATLSSGTTSTYLSTTVHGNQTYDIAFYWSNGTYIGKEILLEEGDVASIQVTGLSDGNTYNWYTINRGTTVDRWRPYEPLNTTDENKSLTWSFSIASGYNTTIRSNGIDYFVWMGDNVSAYNVSKEIETDGSITWSSGEYVAIWNESGTWDADWYVNGTWYEYHCHNDSGNNFTIHTFDVVRTVITDDIGNIVVTMDVNVNIDYGASRSVVLIDDVNNKGSNFTGYTNSTSVTLSDVATSASLANGEILCLWNETIFDWDFYIVGFWTPSVAVYQYDVVNSKVGATRTWGFGGV